MTTTSTSAQRLEDALTILDVAIGSRIFDPEATPPQAYVVITDISLFAELVKALTSLTGQRVLTEVNEGSLFVRVWLAEGT